MEGTTHIDALRKRVNMILEEANTLRILGRANDDLGSALRQFMLVSEFEVLGRTYSLTATPASGLHRVSHQQSALQTRRSDGAFGSGNAGHLNECLPSHISSRRVLDRAV